MAKESTEQKKKEKCKKCGGNGKHRRCAGRGCPGCGKTGICERCGGKGE